MSKIQPAQAILGWLSISAICFLLASLLSWSFSDWHFFSKLVFWGPFLVVGTFTMSDYVFKSRN